MYERVCLLNVSDHTYIPGVKIMMRLSLKRINLPSRNVA